MIELIYGVKGSGKTKNIIDKANARVKTASGNVVFLTDKAKYSLDIDNDIRFVVTAEYGVKYDCCVAAFIKGMLAANADICNFYIDGIARILDLTPDKMEVFMTELEKISADYKVDFTLTISLETVPKFMKRYI